MFDRDGNGFITRDELQTAMEMMQETVTEHQVNEMLQLADLDKDGKINYEGRVKKTEFGNFRLLLRHLKTERTLTFSFVPRICPNAALGRPMENCSTVKMCEPFDFDWTLGTYQHNKFFVFITPFS